jgi:hypothetical protein
MFPAPQRRVSGDFDGDLRVPLDEAAPIALATTARDLLEHPGALTEVRFRPLR